MASQAERAMSFGSIAAEYNRLRSGPPDDAVDWLVPPGCQVAVDLAAGTGLLARALAARVDEVVAVEPDHRMGSVLREHSAGVSVVAGRGEAIPLRDEAADALFISSAWHWMDPELAGSEIARVLRDGGRFGVIWTSRDRQVDWVRDIDWLRDPGRNQGSGAAPSAGRAPSADGVPSADRSPRAPAGRREVLLPESSPFGPGQTATFAFSRTMTPEDFLGMVGTYSGILTAAEPERAATLDRIRAALAGRFPGATEIEVPMRSVCWRTERLAREPS